MFLHHYFLRIRDGLYGGRHVDVASFGAAEPAEWGHSLCLRLMEGVLYHLVQVVIFEGWVSWMVRGIYGCRDRHYALHRLSENRPMLMLIPPGNSNGRYGFAQVHSILILVLLELSSLEVISMHGEALVSLLFFLCEFFVLEVRLDLSFACLSLAMALLFGQLALLSQFLGVD